MWALDVVSSNAERVRSAFAAAQLAALVDNQRQVTFRQPVVAGLDEGKAVAVLEAGHSKDVAFKARNAGDTGVSAGFWNRCGRASSRICTRRSCRTIADNIQELVTRSDPILRDVCEVGPGAVVADRTGRPTVLVQVGFVVEQLDVTSSPVCAIRIGRGVVDGDAGFKFAIRYHIREQQIALARR